MTQGSRHTLMVAFHFPPVQGSSGVHRVLSFAAYLRAKNWRVSVLTVCASAYDEWSAQNTSLIPDGIEVIRAFAFNARKHFSIAGRYPQLLATPDAWQSWIPSAITKAISAHRRNPFDIVYSTYPIASAHVIGSAIRRIASVPWVADFRDPMAQPDYPSDPGLRATFARIERNVMQNASAIMVTTPGAKRFYSAKYGQSIETRLHIVGNGYPDNLPAARPERPATPPLVLLHSGVIYPEERNPIALFRAIQSLEAEGFFDRYPVEIRLRGSSASSRYQPIVDELGVGHRVTLPDQLPYRHAFEEILDADGLLVLQAANCNDQIPAKIYEYLYARRPILALTDADGDTARLLAAEGIQFIAPLDDSLAIKSALSKFVLALWAGINPRLGLSVEQHSRRARAAEFEGILEAVLSRSTIPSTFSGREP
jgi:glycosyltransferase involved in cell wall biosynthesis